MKSTLKINIKRCYPDMTDSARTSFEKKVILQSCYCAVEMFYLWQCSRKKIDQAVIDVKGLSAFQEAKAAGKGVLLLGPHLGAWEMVNLYFAPMTAMFEPPKSEGLAAVIKSGRERFGSTLVPTDISGVKGLFKALYQGKVVGVLPDQDPGYEAGGEYAPFFNISALTMSLPVRLAQKKHTPVFFAFAQRVRLGQFILHFIPVDKDFYSKDMVKALTAMNKGVEQCVAICPDQYQWSYKRFKRSQRDTGKDFYP